MAEIGRAYLGIKLFSRQEKACYYDLYQKMSYQASKILSMLYSHLPES